MITQWVFLLLVLMIFQLKLWRNSEHRFPIVPSTTYFCDAFWTTNSGNMYTIIGGWLDDAGGQGAFAQWVCGAASYTHLNVGASIS